MPDYRPSTTKHLEEILGRIRQTADDRASTAMQRISFAALQEAFDAGYERAKVDHFIEQTEGE